MTVKRILLAGLALLVGGCLLKALPSAPRGYPNAVLHVHVTSSGLPGTGAIDYWIDPRAHIWRTMFTGAEQNTYVVHCPGTSLCRTTQAYDSGGAAPPGPGLWTDLMSSLLGVPPELARSRRVIVRGTPFLYFEQDMQDAPMVRREYWLDPRTGVVMRLRESLAGHLVLDERRQRTLLPPGALPADFFRPSVRASWLFRLATWVESHLTIHQR